MRIDASLQQLLDTYKPKGERMSTLKEDALAYEPPQTLNIADLDKVPVNITTKPGEGTDRDGNTFHYRYAEIDDKKYRIPPSVLGGLKAIIKKMPHIVYVSVIKDGSGMSTRYQVIPWTSEEKVS